MKTIISFFLFSVMILAQPSPTIKTKIQKPLTGVTYTIYVDIKATNTTSALVEDADPLTINLSSYIKTLTNVTVSGDTTFGEFTIPASLNPQYVKVAVSAISVNKKPSLLKVSQWLMVSPRQTKPTFITIQEK